MRIWVGNLKYGITERELKDVLGEHVPIAHIDFAMDPAGRSRGFGWITISDADGPAAIEKCNGLVVGGRPLRAEIATSGGRRQGAPPPA